MSKILLFIPFYNCERQISRVIKQVSPHQHLFSEILIVDNRSLDNGLQVAIDEICLNKMKNVKLVINQENYNLGGSHKVAFQYATENDFTHLIVLHGDDQGNINDLMAHIFNSTHLKFDCLLGSRFQSSSKLIGYSKFRTFGNKVVNVLCQITCKKQISDMGSGLNMYSRNFFTEQRIRKFPNDLTFNVFLLFHACFNDNSIYFFPLSWREEDQVSNAKVFSQFKKILALIIKSAVNKKSIYQSEEDREYKYEIKYQS